MSLELKINTQIDTWQPSGNINFLRARSQILAKIRDFFANRNILEVETPILCQTTATDPPIASFITHFHPFPAAKGQTLYLQTSPEFSMKRLLAAGIGPIYQISKAFRNGECGRYHNPEFTLLEWYRPDFNHHQLMDEIDELLQSILGASKAKRYTYEEIFGKYLGFNPLECALKTLIQCAEENNLSIIGMNHHNRDDWLNLLMTHTIEPNLRYPTFIYNYPASQASLARICEKDPRVAERFELYINGVELANGYHELNDSQEQHTRFLIDNKRRDECGLPRVPIDYRLVEALKYFPDCSGAALGLDRLIMMAIGATSIAEVISFGLESA